MLSALASGTRVMWRLYPLSWGTYHSECVRERYDGWLPATVVSCDRVGTVIELGLLDGVEAMPMTTPGPLFVRTSHGVRLLLLRLNPGCRAVVATVRNSEAIGVGFGRRARRVRVCRTCVVPVEYPPAGKVTGESTGLSG